MLFRSKNKSTTMWDLIVHKTVPPTRLMRYCCSVLKEKGGRNRVISTGVRWTESRARAQRGIYEDINRNKDRRIILNNDNSNKRLLFERCERQAKIIVNPIIDWQVSDVWDYINDNKTPCNPLYCEGYSRVGCIGCPMAGKHRYEEFAKYPKYREAYIMAFDRMLTERRSRGLEVNRSEEHTSELQSRI